MINAPEFEKKQILFAFLSSGDKVTFLNDNIVIKDCSGKIKHQSTCYRLYILFIIGHISVTSGILQKAHKFGFMIVLMNHSLKVYEVLGGHMEGNVLLRRLQYRYEDFGLGKCIIQNKIANSRRLITYERNKTSDDLNVIEKLKSYEERVKNYSGDLAGLLGLEGLAARMFFKTYYNGITWKGRKPRVKPDYVNSTLDIGYTMLFNFIESLLNIYGFDVYCGVLHKEFYMRKSLVCDLMEPFRVLIDKQVRKSINLKQCQEEDFSVINGRFLLKWEKNAEYISFLMKPLLEYKMDIFLYVQGYYRAFMKNKKIEEYPVFVLERYANGSN